MKTKKKIFGINFFSLNYDQKNTLNPLVKSVFKSVDNYRRYLQFCDRRVCSFQYVATQRLQLGVFIGDVTLGRYFALGLPCAAFSSSLKCFFSGNSCRNWTIFQHNVPQCAICIWFSRIVDPGLMPSLMTSSPNNLCRKFETKYLGNEAR